jgi:outer membrane protein assembly factor BamE (lipoprotein component of BamABCDE complex)
VRVLFKAIFLVLLTAAMAGCSTTDSYKGDGNSPGNGSSDPQAQYGGQYRVRSQVSHGVNQ